MFFAIYVLTLAASAACLGIFVHQVLAEQGYTAGLAAGAYVTVGVACAYIALQLMFMGLVALAKPAKGGKVAAAEAVSFAAAAVLLPYLLRMEVPWPDPLLERAAPLVFLGTFAAIHGALKLISFFAALQSEPTSHAYGLVWLVLASVAAAGAYGASTTWLARLEAARPRAPEEQAVYRVGPAYGLARVMPEGALADVRVNWSPGKRLTLRWAPLPDADAPAPARAYVTVTMRGDYSKDYRSRVDLREDGWAHLSVPALEIPPGLHSCTVCWTPAAEPGWRRVTGFRPLRTGGRSVLLSGPFVHAERDSDEGPNVVVILVDGLGPDHTERGGAVDLSTPGLDRFAYTSVDFRRAYTVAPESPAVTVTLLTGLGPLRHGYLGSHVGPLPEGAISLGEMLQARAYATAAFSEGDGYDALTHGSGLERGFEYYDSLYASRAETVTAQAYEEAAELFDPSDSSSKQDGDPDQVDEPAKSPPAPDDGSAPTGSAATLQRAREWMDLHAATRFFLFVRLSELSRVVESAGGPVAEGEEAVTPRAAFDASLASLDRQVAAFVKHIRDFETRSNTIVVFTSPYAYAFTRAGAVDGSPEGLREEHLAVPLYVWAQWLPRAERDDEVSLEDVFPALLAQLNLTAPSRLDGLDCLAGPVGGQPISVGGEPLVMTMRSPRWRLYWDTGRYPFEVAAGSEGSPTLYDMRSRNRSDVTRQFPDTIGLWMDRLRGRLADHDAIWLR